MKPTDHVTRHLLAAARRGEISDERLAALLQSHLETVCPACRREIEAARREETPRSAYTDPVLRVRRRARLRLERRALEDEAAAAPDLLETLDGLSPDQRLLRLRNAPERYANHTLCEELLRRARACLPADPAGSRGWAETAHAVARLYEEPHPAHEIRALAFRGNAERAAGDFEAARSLLREAQELLHEHRVADLELDAELHSFLGSLFTDLRHLDEAAEQLDAASRLYAALEDDEGSARVMMQLANLHRYAGDAEEALEANRAGIALLSPRRTPELYIAARLTYAVDLFESGYPNKARDVLLYDEDLYQEHADRHTWTRFRWLQGRLAADAGDAELAEEALGEIRDHFAAQEHGFNCALVCLDLAALYHREGRHRELLESAAQAIRLFEAHEIHREALAALLLLRDAALSEELTARTIRRVATFLQRAAEDPAARFEPGA